MATTTETRAPDAVGAPGRARYTSVAVTGLVLAGLAPAVALVMALAFGIDVAELAGVLAVAITVPLIAAFLVWRFGTWAKAVGIVGALVPGFLLFFLAFGLAKPTSFGDFVPGLMLPLGVLLGLGGSIAALVASLRGRTETSPSTGERRLVAGVVGLVVLAALVSGVLSVATRTTVDEAAAAGATTVTMKDFAFAEGPYEVESGGSFVVRNDDPFLHDFTIRELDVAVDVQPGSSQLVEIDAPPGEYVIWCTLHSAPGSDEPSPDDMATRVTVR